MSVEMSTASFWHFLSPAVLWHKHALLPHFVPPEIKREYLYYHIQVFPPDPSIPGIASKWPYGGAYKLCVYKCDGAEMVFYHMTVVVIVGICVALCMSLTCSSVIELFFCH